MECLATVHFLAAEDSTRDSPPLGGRRRLYLPTSDQFAEWQNRGHVLAALNIAVDAKALCISMKSSVLMFS
jgi:hypothetical protein